MLPIPGAKGFAPLWRTINTRGVNLAGAWVLDGKVQRELQSHVTLVCSWGHFPLVVAHSGCQRQIMDCTERTLHYLKSINWGVRSL